MSVKDSKSIKGKTNVKKIKKIRVLIQRFFFFFNFIMSSSKDVTKNYSNS